jgi:hypothetical protein
MNEPLNRDYTRWVEADRAGHDDEADAAFRDVFNATVPSPGMPPRFAADTMARFATARVADAKRARRARLALLWGGATVGPVAVYFGAGAAMSAAVALLLGALNLLVSAMVSLAGVSDWNLWSLVGGLGRALGAIMSDADVTFIVIAMHGIAFAALIALQRLLGPDRESYK